MKTNALFQNELEVFRRRNGSTWAKPGNPHAKGKNCYWETRGAKHKNKIERMKQEKEMREMKELQQVPKISKKSKDIVKKLNKKFKCGTTREMCRNTRVSESTEKEKGTLNVIEMLCLKRRIQKKQKEEEMKLKLCLQHTAPVIKATEVYYTNCTNNEDSDRELTQLRKRISEYYCKHKRIANHGVIYHPIQPYSDNNNNNHLLHVKNTNTSINHHTHNSTYSHQCLHTQ